MNKETQMSWVLQKLRETGDITRNECLDRRITRLGSIIHALKRDYGIPLVGRYYKTRKGLDYRYYVNNENN